MATVRLRLDVAYDGTDFHGWAKQPALRTVQGELEVGLQRALAFRETARTVCAGRTDAGVHARGQVVHLDIPVESWDQWTDRIPEFLHRIRSASPPDLLVREATVADAEFDARWSALERRYTYTLGDSLAGADPLRRRYVWGVATSNALDISAMNSAAADVVGEHDFAGFCRRREGATTVRTLLHAKWERVGEEVVLDIRADAFCHSMVRSLVGALVAIGLGRQPASWLGDRLRVGDRTGITVAPPHGLCLEHVVYSEDLAGAAKRSRRRR